MAIFKKYLNKEDKEELKARQKQINEIKLDVE